MKTAKVILCAEGTQNYFGLQAGPFLQVIHIAPLYEMDWSKGVGESIICIVQQVF